jgi:7 transmembrane receptor (rhodopsin family)
VYRKRNPNFVWFVDPSYFISTRTVPKFNFTFILHVTTHSVYIHTVFSFSMLMTLFEIMLSTCPKKYLFWFNSLLYMYMFFPFLLTSRYDPNRRKADLVECHYNQNKGYVVFSAMGSFFIPMAVMIYVYSRICCVLKYRQRNISKTEVSWQVFVPFGVCVLVMMVTSLIYEASDDGVMWITLYQVEGTFCR